MVKEGENYMAFLAGLYQENGQTVPSVDLMKADRMDYLNLLGMAYIDRDLPTDYIDLVCE